jgi:uncharacterized damage-inducible protein DinB
MNRPLLDDAFDHHVWATLRLIDACSGLSPEQLEMTAPGTYGSIIETFRHIVGADCSYLSVLTGGAHAQIDESNMDLAELRAAMAANGPDWSELLRRDLDPDEIIARHRDDGSSSYAPLGIRLHQAVQHGTDHRSHVCTVLTTLGVEPPEIDLWALAWERGTLKEVEAAAPA